jgi:hypothetical protein
MPQIESCRGQKQTSHDTSRKRGREKKRTVSSGNGHAHPPCRPDGERGAWHRDFALSRSLCSSLSAHRPLAASCRLSVVGDAPRAANDAADICPALGAALSVSVCPCVSDLVAVCGTHVGLSVCLPRPYCVLRSQPAARASKTEISWRSRDLFAHALFFAFFFLLLAFRVNCKVRTLGWAQQKKTDATHAPMRQTEHESKTNRRRKERRTANIQREERSARSAKGGDQMLTHDRFGR